MNFFCRSEDLIDFLNIGCDDVLLYCKGLCGWNSEQFLNYKKERCYSLYLNGYIFDVKVVYYVYKYMYFYLRLICCLQISLKNYDVWVLFNKEIG